MLRSDSRVQIKRQSRTFAIVVVREISLFIFPEFLDTEDVQFVSVDVRQETV